MFDSRFPFMDMEKMKEWPIKNSTPEFENSTVYSEIAEQGNCRNCIVSNLFATFETLDKIRGVDPTISKIRNLIVRDALNKRYNFYEDDFAHFTSHLSADDIWNHIKGYPAASL
jgi:hypothetical protein